MLKFQSRQITFGEKLMIIPRDNSYAAHRRRASLNLKGSFDNVADWDPARIQADAHRAINPFRTTIPNLPSTDKL